MSGILPPDTDLIMVDTACSSSLYTIDIGIQGLHEGRYDLAVCGGAFALGPRASILFAKLNGLSARGEVRSLDKDSDGVLFADGAAVVVLKKLSRARADGDQILGSLRTFGSSSDGKGKAIYAPSAAGQKLAIMRARERDASVGVPSWVVAHATGTPAGDVAEFITLRETFAGPDEVLISSNKSVVGHTGWAAGAVSVIQVLLALRHDLIPGQHRFVEAPADFHLAATNLRVPTSAVPWRRTPGKRRVAAVSGFGFGGTNAHMVLAEAPAPAAPITQTSGTTSAPERIAIIARAAHQPDGDALGFGDVYPLPSIKQVVMPPGMMRAIDRTQLMVLECARRIRADLGEFWEEHHADTGVVLGHMGATRNATLYATRCYLDDLGRAASEDAELASEAWFPAMVDRLGSELAQLVPDSSENTCPGAMPNVIPARVANYFDLRGLNMTVDTGLTSAATAIDVAIRYLRSGELSVALAGGINGNSTTEMRWLVDSALEHNRRLAEGCFMFALTTESAARAAGVPILGFVEAGVGNTVAAPPADVVACGDRTDHRDSCYLGAEAGFALMGALDDVTAHHADVMVRCTGGRNAPDAWLSVAPSSAGPAAAEAPVVKAAGLEPPRSFYRLPAHLFDPAFYAAGQPTRVHRHISRFVPESGTPAEDGSGTPITFWPSGDGKLADTVLLTDTVAVAHRAAANGATAIAVLAVGAAGATAAGVHAVTGPVDAGAIRAALGDMITARGAVHIRTVLNASPAGVGTDEQARLHEALFLSAQLLADRLELAGSSCVTVALGGYATADVPAPIVGLFRGLTKVLHLEFPASSTFLLVTDADVLDAGIAQAEQEGPRRRSLPAVYYRDGTRLVERIQVAPGTLRAADDPRIGPDSVVVAVGGGRGITAELLVQLARHAGPRIIVLGSNPLDSHPAGYLGMSGERFAAARAGYIRDWLRDNSGSVKDASASFSRIADARLTLANLGRIRAFCGDDRVSYVCCNATDRSQVDAAIASILAEGPVDLLINAAGLNRSAPVRTKSHAEFRLVRDLKLVTYRNLRAAFASAPPKLWVNFGSLVGVTGIFGEADYASANDYLAAARFTPTRSRPARRLRLRGHSGARPASARRRTSRKAACSAACRAPRGVHHFLRELAMADPVPLSAHLGAAENDAVERLLPGFLALGEGAATVRAPVPMHPSGQPATRVRRAPGFFIDREVSRDPASIVFERTFDLSHDGYLDHHRVAGVPTLPGLFATELAFEAAARLAPDLAVCGFEEIEFLHFLKLHPGRSPVPHRITAKVLRRCPDSGRVEVGVRVAGDVVTPNGTVLVRDRTHFRATVLMAPSLPAAPLWDP